MNNITVSDAAKIVALAKQLAETRSYLKRLDEMKPRAGKFFLSGYTTDGRDATYEAGGSDVCEIVRGHIRREHQKIAASCERQLRGLGVAVA